MLLTSAMRSFITLSSLYSPALPYGGTLCDTIVAVIRERETEGSGEGERTGWEGA